MNYNKFLFIYSSKTILDLNNNISTFYKASYNLVAGFSCVSVCKQFNYMKT